MLLLAGALVEFGGDLDFARRYRETLKLWADYLLDKGYDPENQLCTDDFAGHLAHNTNLSLKAILALGAWAAVEKKLGNAAESKKYRAAAEEAAKRWKNDACDESGFYRLAFDRPGSWSQKYNLVWDRLLGLGPKWRTTGKSRPATACRSTAAGATRNSTGSSGARC